MRLVADLHLHSKYSRATSPKMNVRELSDAAKVKGINVLGTGDFTHPKHIADLKRDLVAIDDGLFSYNGAYFVLSAEISTIFSWEKKVRKVHNVILAPSFEIVDQINERIRKWGRVDYDGRPTFGKTCVELMELCMSVSKDVFVFPAHVWTPWFSVFGSNSGFDRVEDCYQEYTKHIHALETGMSSDPAMNWRLSALDKYALVSNSDSHSPYPWRLGREANAFELKKPSYFDMMDAIKEKDPKRFLYTIETDPGYGKYHFDGHRECNVSLSPEESKKYNDICPVCRKPLTIGVLHRVEELADRPIGFVPPGAIPFKSLIPLSELIAALYGTTPESKAVYREFNVLINAFGNEMAVLLDSSFEKLVSLTSEKVANAILRNREAKLKIKPGYDGVYGRPVFDEDEKPEKGKSAQRSMLDY
jgi:uncharacterized protein (TIGR00375 family)